MILRFMYPTESQGVSKTVLHKLGETKKKKNGIRIMSSKVSLPHYLHKSLLNHLLYTVIHLIIIYMAHPSPASLFNSTTPYSRDQIFIHLNQDQNNQKSKFLIQ